jgi:hypothetical protein
VSSITAVVTVERTSGTRGDVVARFVRMRAGSVDDDALRMVGAAIELPALGTCSRLQNNPSRAARMELVSAGAVSLEADGFRGNLLARQVPDVVDVVGGVVYTARAEGDVMPARGRFTLRASGTIEPDFEIAPFTVDANIPGEPSDLRVAGDTNNAAVSSSEPTEITWESAGGDDVIYLDVAGRGADKVRCLFADSGRASLATSNFPSDEGTITVHRVHRESFHARGIDAGLMRFDFARVVGFHRR